MFGTNAEIERLKKKIREMETDYILQIREKDFDMRHLKDNEVLKLKEEKIELQKKLAVVEKENAMLDKIVDLNADIVDVKELINQLIKKIPSIDLKSLTINNRK